MTASDDKTPSLFTRVPKALAKRIWAITQRLEHIGWSDSRTIRRAIEHGIDAMEEEAKALASAAPKMGDS